MLAVRTVTATCGGGMYLKWYCYLVNISVMIFVVDGVLARIATG